MEKLQQKLREIKDLLKNVPPSPKPPKVPSAPEVEHPQQTAAPMKPNTPKSKKDPEKVAQQLKDPEIRADAVDQAKKLKEGIKEKTVFNTRGQWKLHKTP